MAVAERPAATDGSTISTGVMHTLSGQWIRFLVQVVSVVVLARLVSPADFGLFALVAAIAAVAIVLSDSGLTYAAVQAAELTHEQQTNLFWIGVLAGSVATGLVLLLAPALAVYYDEPRVVVVVWAVAPVFLMSAVTAQFRVDLSRRLCFAQLAAGDVIGQVTGLAVALVIAVVSPSVWALVAQQVTTVAVSMVLVVCASRWSPGLPSRSAEVRPLLRYSGGVAGDQLLGHLSTRADIIALGRYAEIAEVGLYARMHQLFSIPLLQLAAPLTRVALPHLSRADGDDYCRLLVSAQRALAYAFVLVYAFVVVAAEPLVAVTLGSAWTGGAVVLAVLAVGGMFQGVGYVYYWVFLSKARMGLALRLALISRVSMIVVVFAAAPAGPVWVATAVSASMAVTWLVQTAVGMPRAGVDPVSLLLPVVRPVLVGAAVVLAGLALTWFIQPPGPWAALGLLTLSSVAAVAVCGLLVRPVRRDLCGYLRLLRTRTRS